MMLIPHPHCLQKGPLDLIETGKGLKVQTDKPHLVSLGSGRLSTAITLLPLEEGKLRSILLPPFHSSRPFCPRVQPCVGALLLSVDSVHLPYMEVCATLPHQFASLVSASTDRVPSLVDNLAHDKD